MGDNKNHTHASEPVDLAVIGYSQAGKTTLAVGLFATSCASEAETLVVSGVGEDTRNYLMVRKAALEGGHWLEATTEGQMPDLRLSVRRLVGGRECPPVEVRFREYMGERACNVENYKRDVVGDPQGALVLLNPCMAVLRDVGQRNRMLAQIKSVIDYLAEPGRRCRFVALVVTAADTLTTSLRDFAQEFDGYKAEIANHLAAGPFRARWKEFAVTVSGELKDPASPCIAPGAANTSRLPFLWLIDSLEEAARRERAGAWKRRGLSGALALLLVAGGSFAWWYCRSDRHAERMIDALMRETAPALDRALADGETAKINGACQALEKGRGALPADVPFFSVNRERLARKRAALDEKIDDARLRWYPLDFDRVKQSLLATDGGGLDVAAANDRLEQLRSYGRERFDRFQPVGKGMQERHRALRAEWERMQQEVAAFLEGAVSTWMAQFLKDCAAQAAAKASAETCAAWRREIEAWQPADAARRQEREAFLRQFDAEVESWRGAHERRLFAEGVPRVRENLAKADKNVENGDALHAALLACRTYERLAQREDASGYVPWPERQAAWSLLREARRLTLDAVQDVLLRGSGLNPHGAQRPSVSDRQRMRIQAILRDGDALSEADFRTWWDAFAARIGQVCGDWTANQMKIGKETVARMLGCPRAADVLLEFDEFYNRHACSPALHDVVRAVHAQLSLEFERIRSDFQKADRRQGAFSELRVLCSSLARCDCPALRKSCWYSLAERCVELGCGRKGELAKAFPQRIAVTRVDVLHDYKATTACLIDCRLTPESPEGTAADVTDPKKACEIPAGEWRTVWQGSRAVSINPWTPLMFSFDAAKVRNWWTNQHSRGGLSLAVAPGGKAVSVSEVAPKGGPKAANAIARGDYFEGVAPDHFRYRVYFEGEGVSLEDVWPRDTELRLE